MNPAIEKYGVCLQTYISLRKDPYKRAEMVTQILFGEYVEILDDEGKWLFVKVLHDNYQGWIDKKCIEFTAKVNDTVYLVCSSGLSIINLSTGQKTVAAIACSLPELDGNKFELGNYQFELNDSGKLIKPGPSNKLESIIDEVLGLPYLWGGRSGFGFDCSGLTQYLGRICGVNLSRDASEQAAEGETLSFINEVKVGDLAFFDDTEGMIHHVGMMLGDGKIIHASGTVKIDNLDQQGIYNKKIGAYTHKLRVMKRVIK